MEPAELWSNPWWLCSVSLVFGLVIGSFLNVVIYRLPEGESIVSPGSRCPACRTPLTAVDNVPVFSYLWLRGRCRHCGVRISPRYPAVEAVTGIVFAGIAWRFGLGYATPLLMLFAAALIAAAMIDLDHQIIPDEISLGGLLLGIFAVPTAHWLAGQPLWPAVQLSLLGAVLGGGILWIVAFLHARLCVALGRQFDHWPGDGEAPPRPSSIDYWTWFPGLGFGDVKLMAMIGAFLGPTGVLATIFAAAISGLVLGVGWALVKHSWSSPFGFGPAIALGALMVLLVPMQWLPV